MRLKKYNQNIKYIAQFFTNFRALWSVGIFEPIVFHTEQTVIGANA